LGRAPQLKEAKVVALVFERETYEALKRAARLRQMSVSALVRELVNVYLWSAGLLPSPQPEQPAAPVSEPDLETDGAPALPQTESERKWRLLVKLDEPMVEGLVKDVARLKRLVEELKQVPVSKRLTDAFVSRRSAARRKLVDLKKVARYLIRAGANLPEEVVDELVEIERVLNSLD